MSLVKRLLGLQRTEDGQQTRDASGARALSESGANQRLMDAQDRHIEDMSRILDIDPEISYFQSSISLNEPYRGYSGKKSKTVWCERGHVYARFPLRDDVTMCFRGPYVFPDSKDTFDHEDAFFLELCLDDSILEQDVPEYDMRFIRSAPHGPHPDFRNNEAFSRYLFLNAVLMKSMPSKGKRGGLYVDHGSGYPEMHPWKYDLDANDWLRDGSGEPIPIDYTTPDAAYIYDHLSFGHDLTDEQFRSLAEGWFEGTKEYLDLIDQGEVGRGKDVLCDMREEASRVNKEIYRIKESSVWPLEEELRGIADQGIGVVYGNDDQPV